jgi:hypothetical protein
MTDTQATQTTQDTETILNGPTNDGNQATTSPPAAAAPSAPKPVATPPPLDDLVASIRASVAPGVSAEARAIGATACRAILTALETQPGQPLAAAPPSAPAPASSLAGMLSQLAAMPREQLLGFLRDKFPAAPPSSRPTRPTAGPRFHLIQLPQLRRPDRP